MSYPIQVTASDLRACYERPGFTISKDFLDTERLKAAMSRLRSVRDPSWLSAGEMEPIFRWKLDRQYGRSEHHRDRNPENVYQVVTKACFAVRTDNLRVEAAVRVKLLCALHGVAVPVASAVLALAEPERYCVIDFRGWRALFGERREGFGVPQYLRYLDVITGLANELSWTVQLIDFVARSIDRERSTPSSCAQIG